MSSVSSVTCSNNTVGGDKENQKQKRPAVSIFSSVFFRGRDTPWNIKYGFPVLEQALYPEDDEKIPNR